MSKISHIHPPLSDDLRGFSRLVIDATVGITGLVENMHSTILRTPALLGTPTQKRTRGITGLTYRSIVSSMRLVGSGLDAALHGLAPLLPSSSAVSGRREALVAAINGVLGDHLRANMNPLAVNMELRHNGRPVSFSEDSLPQPSSKLLIVLHGLCMNDRQWLRKGHDHGAELAAEGFSPLYLRYNSGLHISTNGCEFANQMEALIDAWPVPVSEIVLLGHSMGGLVSRSACHYGELAGHRWTGLVRKIIFLGTPHHGSPLERGGNWIDRVLGVSPYTAAFTRLGKIRSAGITDLRHGNVLDEHWQHRDRFARDRGPAMSPPLPSKIKCYAVGATLADDERGIVNETLGDGLVQLSSALGRHVQPEKNLNIPASRQRVVYGTHHMDLLSSKAVYAQLRQWIAEP